MLRDLLVDRYDEFMNYFGVQGNSESLKRFYHLCRRILLRWLNRRSQRRSYTWDKFDAMLRRHAIPPPRIVELPRQPTFL